MPNAKGMPRGLNRKLDVCQLVCERKEPMFVAAFREKKSQRNSVILLSTGHGAKNETKANQRE